MTDRAMPLTEAALRKALVELAGEPDANALLTDVMRAVEGMPQMRRRPWDIPPLGRGALLLAAALATLGIGAAVALSQPRPDPQPTPSAPALLPDVITVAQAAEPFRYQIPEGEADTFNEIGGSGASGMFALHHEFGSIAVFPVTGDVHTCELEDGPEPSAEPVRVTAGFGTDPRLYREGLRDRVGIGIGEIHPSMLGNLPAMEAEIGPSDSSTCYPQVHEDGLGLGSDALEPELRGPGKLIVAHGGLRTVGVLINAVDEAAYDKWLPIAEVYVGSFDFYAADH